MPWSPRPHRRSRDRCSATALHASGRPVSAAGGVRASRTPRRFVVPVARRDPADGPWRKVPPAGALRGAPPRVPFPDARCDASSGPVPRPASPCLVRGVRCARPEGLADARVRANHRGRASSVPCTLYRHYRHLPAASAQARGRSVRQDRLNKDNLTSQLFQTLDRRQLAEALNRCSALPANELAGQIAGIEFEKSIKGALRISPTVHENLWPLVRRVRRVCLQEGLDRSRQKRWEEAVDIRNALIHPTGSWSTDDIGRLVEAMAEANQLLPRRTLPVRR